MRHTVSAVLVASVLLGLSASGAAAQSWPMDGYAQWRAASPYTKDRLVVNAISAIQTGWSLGSAQAQADVGRYLVGQSSRGKVSIGIAGAVGSMQLTNPPRYSHPLKYYVHAIDRAYQRFPQNRAIDVPSLLTCFADHAVGKCSAVARTPGYALDRSALKAT